MTDLDHLQIVQFFFSVALLWFWYAYMYKRTRAHKLREDLFTIRDELFDYMWQHDLSYNLPAYRLMRDFLNGTIRFADQLNLFPFLLIAYRTRDMDRNKKPGALVAIEKIEDAEIRGHYHNIYQQVWSRLVKHLFLEGPQWIVFKPIQLTFRRIPTARESTRERLQVAAMADEFLLLGRRNSPEAQFLFQNLHISPWR